MSALPSIEVRPLPSLEDFAAFLFSRPDADTRHQKALLLHYYASVWSNVEGIPASKARQMADELLDEAWATSAEREAEAS